MSEVFFEREWSGFVSFGYAYDRELYKEKSPFQDLRVLSTPAYGNMLVLDDSVMLTDSDEFVYHEMIAHVPMSFHPRAKNILVIGGGDGGTVRELLRHRGVEKITLCEIDEAVIRACEKFFPKVACGLRDPRVNIVVGDGIEYMKRYQNEFDVVIVDSCDPIGPAEGLFTADFYRSASKALKENGVMVAQTECPWWDAKILRPIYENIRAAFPMVKPYIGSVPTYPRGLWSWTLATKDEAIFERDFDPSAVASFEKELSYLRADNILAAFRIPNFYRKKLGLEAV